jgi:Sec-independent protein translocase protein TatA
MGLSEILVLVVVVSVIVGVKRVRRINMDFSEKKEDE